MNLIALLVILLIFCVVLWAARAIMAAFGVGDPIATIVYVVIVLFGLIWLIGQLGVLGGGGPVLHLGNVR
jgi:hypothetical protein